MRELGEQVRVCVRVCACANVYVCVHMSVRVKDREGERGLERIFGGDARELRRWIM